MTFQERDELNSHQMLGAIVRGLTDYHKGPENRERLIKMLDEIAAPVTYSFQDFDRQGHLRDVLAGIALPK